MDGSSMDLLTVEWSRCGVYLRLFVITLERDIAAVVSTSDVR
jgi:hypothetical protein